MEKIKEFFKNETVRKFTRGAVFIAANILIILGGLGLNYGTRKSFWLIMLALGCFIAYALVVEIPRQKTRAKNKSPQKSASKSYDSEDDNQDIS
jgi:hypothetical protein